MCGTKINKERKDDVVFFSSFFLSFFSLKIIVVAFT